MDKNEVLWDRKLKINTIGRDDTAEDPNHYPYEPTPYSVLEKLAKSGYLTSENGVVDYGSGKGRASFYLSWKLGCRTVGVEFDEVVFQDALDNLKSCTVKNRASFVMMGAEVYSIDILYDSFYFFNPFSVKVLQSVIVKIRDSWYTNQRAMKLFFYYPSDDYISYLMSVDELSFLDEIDCSDLFEGENQRERILVFEMGC